MVALQESHEPINGFQREGNLTEIQILESGTALNEEKGVHARRLEEGAVDVDAAKVRTGLIIESQKRVQCALIRRLVSNSRFINKERMGETTKATELARPS